jgi:ATP-binding cassette subfamily B protein RaxB
MKLPVLLQTNAGECGIVCLAMVATALGRPVALAELRARAGVASLGNSLRTLMDLAGGLDLHTRALRLEPDDAARLATPCILLWGTQHYVVLKRVTSRHWIVHDPATGLRRYRRRDVDRFFSGVALELTPAGKWQAQVPPRLRFSALWAQATGLVPVLVTIGVLSILVQIVALLSPLYVQLVVDDALARNDADLLPVLALAFGALAVLGALTAHLRTLVVLRAGCALADQLAANLVGHLLRLPLLFFVQRDIGDINARFGSLDPVLKVFTSGIVTVIIDGALALTTLALLFAYEETLAAIVVAFLVVTLCLRLGATPRLRALTQDTIRAGAAEQTTFIESLRSIVSLKANGMERTRAALWRGRHAESIGAGATLAVFGTRIDLAQALIVGVENVVVVYFGARAVMDAEVTVGMMYAFIAYKSHFGRAAAALLEQLVELRLLRLHLERLFDIVGTDAEAASHEHLLERPIGGGVQVRGVGFRYAPSLPAVLRDVQFSVGPGEHVAIVGGSGCGKSTLLRILLGLITPTEGEVLLDDGRRLADARDALRRSTGAVLQGDALFTGSIRDNVSLFDLEVDDVRVAECCRLAAVDDDIRALPMGYDTPLGDMGVALSAGQVQRLLIARALYKSPRLLVLDEATANLDDATRARINRHLESLGATVIRVSHRPDEIAAADTVYEIEQGQLRRVPA